MRSTSVPFDYARSLTGAARTKQANRQLGLVLAFVAGATNAGGFLAVHRYTSHMTGIVSALADDLIRGSGALVLTGIASLLSFVAGAACTALMVNYARRQKMRSQFAWPLLLEALLLLVFGVLGARLSDIHTLFVPVTVLLLCFIMGLQNAVITKISNAEIRTTHVTGIVTDIGIELGKALYWHSARSDAPDRVFADRQRLGTLCALLASFSLGGVAGVAGFNHLGYASTLPLALALATLACVPALDDLAASRARRARQRQNAQDSR